MKPTPGPWSVDGGGADAAVVASDGKDVALTYTGGAREADEDAANARLIACAPDLAATLRECESVLAEVQSTLSAYGKSEVLTDLGDRAWKQQQAAQKALADSGFARLEAPRA